MITPGGAVTLKIEGPVAAGPDQRSRFHQETNQRNAQPTEHFEMTLSARNIDTNFDALSDLDLVEIITSAIPPFSDKHIARMADATTSAVKNWRSGRNAPGLVKSLRLGRRVPQVAAAIIEVLRAGTAMGPNPERLITILFSEMLKIAKDGDELSAARARRALEQFAQVSAGMNVTEGRA